MNNEAYSTSSVGEIVNLMAVDAQSMQNITGSVWMVWSCPLVISVAIYLLWGIVGPSVLAGVAVMVLMVPINAAMATVQRRLQVIVFIFNITHGTPNNGKVEKIVVGLHFI